MYFFKRINIRATPAIIARTINQAKSVLNAGYTEEEIIKTIDYIIDVNKVEMYSFGYVNSAIGNVIRRIEEEEKQTKPPQKINYKEVQENLNEVIDVESSNRNKQKLSRFNTKSRFREKSYIDLFEKPGQDN